MTDSQPPSRLEQILSQTVFTRGANVPFGDLTADQARARANELRAATGWGPTARVAPVALAWRELTVTMERDAAAAVSDLDPEVIAQLAPRLWIVPPGGSLL
jgi:hypothetical protein